MSERPEKIAVTKIDAAQQQLDSAIELWFREKSTISIHTLAAAAYEVVHAIHRKQGKEVLLYDTDYIKTEYQQKFAQLLRSPANFFKHADKDFDPRGTFEFAPFMSEVFMVFTIIGLRNLGQPDSPLVQIFLTWLAIRNPQWAPVGLRKHFQDTLPAESFAQLESVDKVDFLEMCLLAKAQIPNRVAV